LFLILFENLLLKIVRQRFKIFSIDIFIFFPAISLPVSPCVPSPCSFNAICKEQHGAGSCSCLPDYIGNPYEGCRPECVVDTDCISTFACIQSKCKDPCPGVCGQFAECQVINHRPSCTCIPGYSGNPFQYCTVFRDTGTNIYLIINAINPFISIFFIYSCCSKFHFQFKIFV
jgi:hypothetical protein